MRGEGSFNVDEAEEHGERREGSQPRMRTRSPKPVEAGPFERHLRDAIALNRERAPRYAELSRGTSQGISTALIGAELALLPVARWFDAAARPYHAAGIPLLEEVFVPMSNAPAFEESRLMSAAAHVVSFKRPRAIRLRVRRAYREGSFNAAAEVLEDELALLAVEPETNCLLRHLLESAYRLALLAPTRVTQAQARGLRSPAPLLGRLLALHLWGLRAANALDRRALPLQRRGIAILTQDLPRIPPSS